MNDSGDLSGWDRADARPPSGPGDLPGMLGFLLRRLFEGEPTEDGDSEIPRIGPRRRKKRTRRQVIFFSLLAVIPLLLILIGVLVTVYTDVLWFREVGYTRVYWTRILAQFLTGVAGGLLFFAIFATNLLLAWRLSPKMLLKGDLEGDNPVLEVVERIESRPIRWVLMGIAGVLAFFFALGAGGMWEQVLLFLNRVDFGVSDPIFGRDASFFVFVLPLAQGVLSFLFVTLILTLIAVVVLYLIDQAIAIRDNRLSMAPHVKAHLSVLAAFALLLKAADYLLATWELNYSTRGTVFGASYTDIHAELPVLRVLAVVALISAIILIVNIYYRGWRLPIIAVGIWAVVWVVAGQIYPALVQQYRVSPNEIAVESPYIANNIEATRWAYGLTAVTQTDFPANPTLSLTEIGANTGTVKNIRLWDTAPLLATYTQIQQLRPYYTIRDVDVDRYTVDGEYRQVMLAAREMDQEGLSPQAQTWVNQHLTYTHGFGLVMSAVNEATREGLPAFFVQDIPPRTDTDLTLAQERSGLYYGELGGPFVLVRTTANEFDYPRGSENVYTTYEGKGGIPVSSLLRQIAFSWRFGTLKLLASDYLEPDSRIMFRRSLAERVRTIAPFLTYDRDPYPILREDGSIVWIWDAYTTSTRFPYSQPRGNGINYIRNSVKVTVDAYDGTVTFYQVDPEDAMAKAWGQVFPGLFTPGDQMPEEIRRHLRYPEDLFSTQSEVMTVYHMQDPQVFYNREDVWTIPNEQYAGEEVQMVPYYVIMALPDTQQEEFLLLQPFAPLRRDNMVAWMAARMDGDAYGQLQVFEFPKDKLVFGPAQIESRISNDPAISAQITLWDQAGSNVIRGNLLVIPIEDSIVYVEPVYLQAETSPIPELRRVIVVYDQNVVMEPTLEEALGRLFERTAGTTTTSLERPGTTTSGPPTTGTGTTGTGTGTTQTTAPAAPTTGTTQSPAPPTTQAGGELPTDRASLIALAQQHYEQALAAQQRGDWAEYGRQIEELGRVITALEAAAQ